MQSFVRIGPAVCLILAQVWGVCGVWGDTGKKVVTKPCAHCRERMPKTDLGAKNASETPLQISFQIDAQDIQVTDFSSRSKRNNSIQSFYFKVLDESSDVLVTLGLKIFQTKPWKTGTFTKTLLFIWLEIKMFTSSHARTFLSSMCQTLSAIRVSKSQGNMWLIIYN